MSIGLLSDDVASSLKANNRANEQKRAGMVWFCFFPPQIAGQWGIGCFFRSWGGEALYNYNEGVPQNAAAISSIGIPCLVEAVVPISSFKSNLGLCFKVVRRFLVSRGHQTVEPVDHEDKIVQPLPPQNVRRIVRFGEVDFAALTGCDEWPTQKRIR